MRMLLLVAVTAAIASPPLTAYAAIRTSADYSIDAESTDSGAAGASANYSIVSESTNSVGAGAQNAGYQLFGGFVGQFYAVAFEISSFTRLANGHILLQCFGVPNNVNTIQASPNLISSFTTLATMPADATGAFQYEDMNAGSFPKRFYRLSFP
jgi:hypothetical protein